MEIPISHIKMQGDDAGSVLFNRIASGETVRVNGLYLDIEMAIRNLVDTHSWHYEQEYMTDD